MQRSASALSLSLVGILFLLTGCSGKPTLNHCQNPDTRTTVCNIPQPPLVEVKPLFPEARVARNINLETLREKARLSANNCENCIKTGYSIQIGLFQKTFDQEQLVQLKSNAQAKVLYRYSFSDKLTGITAGYFSDKKTAREHLSSIRDKLPNDAYITQLPENAELIAFPTTD